MRLLALVAIAFLLSGCTLYPAFDASVHNRTDHAVEVRVTVYREETQVFQADKVVAPNETWDAGVFTRREGEYRIVVDEGGLVVAEATRTFGHDEGPGGFTVRFGPDGPPEITFWHN